MASSKSSGSKKKKTAAEDPNSRHVCSNRKARHEYEILDDVECGVVLLGSEVKSVRAGKVSLDQSYARVKDNELFLVGVDIAEYPQANFMNHEPKRTRKLLLHRRELKKFAVGAEQQGYTLVPLDVYFKRGLIKVRIGLARGRKLHDKREKLKQDDAKRDMQVALRKRV